jgi:hypothetical protein
MRFGRLLGYLLIAGVAMSIFATDEEQSAALDVDLKPEAIKVDPALSGPKLSDPPEIETRVSLTPPDAIPETDALQLPAQPELRANPPTAMAPQRPRKTKGVYVTGSRVNVRRTPEIAANVLGQFNKGVKLIAVETQGGWTKVRNTSAAGPAEGWMSAKYLSQKAPENTRTASRATAPRRNVAIPTSSEITVARQQIIRRSISAYQGSCPCPYNTDRANRRCGKRSAWSRPGGYSPICYQSDVTRSQLVSYFARLGKQMP